MGLREDGRRRLSPKLLDGKAGILARSQGCFALLDEARTSVELVERGPSR
jgi:hypothetical protein